MRPPVLNRRCYGVLAIWRAFWSTAVLFFFPSPLRRIFASSQSLLALSTILLSLTICARADDLMVTNETPSFMLDTRLPADASSTNSLIVQAHSPPFTLDVRMSDGIVPTSGTVGPDSGPFVLDTRMPDGIVPSPGTAFAESPSFTLDTRLPTEITPTPYLVTEAESPSFLLDTRLSVDTTLLPNLVTQTEASAFTLDTRIPVLVTWWITTNESSAFTLDTRVDSFTIPAQILTGGITNGRLRFSPDGLRIAKIEGSTVLLWNLQSPQQRSAFVGHSAEVTSLQFSPLGDQLLTGSADGTFCWWDTASRAELGRTNPPGSGAVYAAYASDGARILAGRGGSASLYRVPTMNLEQGFAGSSGTISAVAVSSEGFAMAGNSDRYALIWDITSGAVVSRLTNHVGLNTAVGFLPAGSNALTASLDGTIRIWETATGEEKLVISQGSPIADATLSLDGALVVSCSYDPWPFHGGNAYLWETQSGKLLGLFSDPSGDNSTMRHVAISPDHTAVAASYADGTVRLWNTGLPPKPAATVTPLPTGTTLPLTLRSHGLYYFEVPTAAGRSFVITVEGDTGGAKELRDLGIRSVKTGISSAVSTDAEFANLGQSRSPGPSARSLQTPPPGADITALRMTATKGHLPSVYDYEAFAQASVTNLHCELPMVTLTNDKVYVLVFAPYLSAGSLSVRIHADYADFKATAITPSRGGTAGNVTVKIEGTGIAPDATARLVSTDGGYVTGEMVMWAGPTKAWFTFPLQHASEGLYDVELRKSGATSVPMQHAFTVFRAVGLPVGHATSGLVASLTAPSAVRPGRQYSMTLRYENTTGNDLAAPLFDISVEGKHDYFYSPGGGPGGGYLRLTGPNRFPFAQILGLNQDGPPGILPPGVGFDIPIYFEGAWDANIMEFKLSVLKADSTPIDWSKFDGLRPDGMASDLWSAIYGNFKKLLGSTWTDYLRNMAVAGWMPVEPKPEGGTWSGYLDALDNQAHLLALAGQPADNIGTLLAALFALADNAPYVRTIAAGLDAQAPAPGLPLRFARFATSGLEQRFAIGPLGRGWSHVYQYSLTQSGNTTVTIHTPGGGARTFSLGVDGLWHGNAGDYGNLVATSSGGFTLVEKGGVTWTYDAGGFLISIGEPNGNAIALGYSGGQLTSLAHSAGVGFTLQYNSQGRLARLVDHAGQVTEYEYDSTGEYLLRATTPGAITHVYTYQAASGSAKDHALTRITFPDNTHQFFAWDDMGRLSEQSRDGETERLRFEYGSSGYLTVRDANNAPTTLRLGPFGQALQIADPLGRSASFNYDASNNVTRLIGPGGEVTELAYDGRGNPTSVINPLGQQIALQYGGLNRLTGLHDARNQSTRFAYDDHGNLASIGYEDNSVEQFGYTTNGSVATWQNRRGQTIQLTRNDNGQVTQKLYPDGRTIDYAYDARGLLTNVTDSAQGATHLAYDPRGFLSAITYPDGKGFTFEYNNAGRRTRRIGHDGYTLNYGYDSAGRLETLADGTGFELVRYAYDAAGRLSRESKGNGTFATYTYDLAGQIVVLRNCAPDGTVQSFFNYTYDAKGNRLTMATTAGVTSYSYDALNQLTSVTYPGGRHVIYSYDPAGNRTVVNDSGTNTAYTANSLNQYTRAGDATFAYDADGNMTRRTDATGTTTYDYDTENRLVRVATPTNGVFQYVYDAMGNRTSIIHDGVATRFMHDPIGLVDVAAEYDGGGALVARYDHAIGLVSRTDGTGTAFYSFDALGNTRELTGAAGAVMNSYDYDAFGAAMVANETVANSYRFVGRFGVSDGGRGLHLMRQRSYSSEIGRFTTVDPIRFTGGLNLMNYVGNNPVLFIDPTGLVWETFKVDFSGGAHIPIGPGSQIGGSLSSSWNGQIGNASKWTGSGWQNDVQLGGVADIGVSVGASWGNPDMTISIGEGRYGTGFYVSFEDGKFIGFGVNIGLGLPLGTWPLTVTVPIPDGQTSPVGGGADIPVVRPIDPNDKIGPNGVGPNRVVSTNDFLEYMVRFENMPTASAPVQELIVVDYLDPALDWTTAEFQEIAYGDRLLTPPIHAQSFVLRDAPPPSSSSLTGPVLTNLAVVVSGMFNSQLGRAEWRMTCIDTNTGLWPIDALSGFLPPEDGTGRGQGYVKFRVKPKATTPVGTGVTNVANIVFDNNDPISTPAVWNIVGDVPPLAVTIAYPPMQATVRTPFIYTIGLTNTGTNLVENVILTNTLPPGITLSNAAATVGTVTLTNGTVIWDFGTLTNGTGGTLTVVALPTQEGTFENTISYSGGSGLAIYSTPSDITVVGPTRPSLAIRISGGMVELSWPTNSTGFLLQQTSVLGPSPAWETLIEEPAVIGQDFHLDMPSTNGTQFYRLNR